ncbi:MAG TPA: class I SAM-dependent methyltransferase [Candidatus Acidoferrales bacterium]|nr:class I SAM-dependent methyltransferase [Candidatus Acidoferrales bacterium]
MKSEAEHVRLNEAKWDGWSHRLDGDGWRYRYLRRMQAGLISLLDVREGVNFLDIGCGTGWAVGQVGKLVGDNGLFFGIDISSVMIEKAKESFTGRANFHFIKANVESIPLEDNFFDIIICTNSFHHYLNPDNALREMHRLLKNTGKVYVLDPTADKWIVKVAGKIIGMLEPAHVKLYSTKEFQSLFAGAGLKYAATRMVDGHQIVHVGER